MFTNNSITAQHFRTGNIAYCQDLTTRPPAHPMIISLITRFKKLRPKWTEHRTFRFLAIESGSSV